MSSKGEISHSIIVGLFSDFVVLKQSHPNHFLEVERHGNLAIAFDKANLLAQPSLNRSSDKSILSRLNILQQSNRLHLNSTSITPIDLLHMNTQISAYQADITGV